MDSALLNRYPRASRWDFGIVYDHVDSNAEVVYWVEFHPASDSRVKVVIKKAQWLLQWLREDANALSTFDREIVWVSSGATSFTLSAPQRKQMAQAGLIHRGGILRISNKRSD